MNNLNKTIGYHGENIICKYYLKNGYIILDRNFRNRFGEIDLIAKKNDVIIFIEVKSRYNSSFGFPSESISPSKQRNIKLLSKFYLSFKKLTNVYIRYDVAEVFLNYYDEKYKINIIEDAFR